MGEPGAQLHGAVLHVNSLERAVDFYTRLLDLDVARRTSEAVLLASHAGSCALALRERRVEHPTDATVQALIWRVPTPEMLTDYEQRLDALDARPTRHDLAEDATTLITARDPDGQRLLLLHHDGEQDLPRDIPPEVFWY